MMAVHSIRKGYFVKSNAVTPHNAVVSTILAQHPTARKRGFKKAVLEAVRQDAIEHGYLDEVVDQFSGSNSVRIVPDAYLIDSQEKTVVFFEVEDNSRLTPEKLHEYANTALCLDGIQWELVLVSFDIYLNGRVIDLGMFLAADAAYRHNQIHGAAAQGGGPGG